jgi:flagellar biosynthetic protein FliR
VSPLEALLRPELFRFSLELTRIAGVIAMAPLAWSMAPIRARVGLALVLTVVVHGANSQLVAAPVFRNEVDAALAVATELIVGFAFGFVVRLALAIGEVVGEVITPAMGLGAAQIFDPLSHVTHGVITTLLRHFSLLIALLLGLHRVALGGLLHSFRVLPVGGMYDPARAWPSVLALSVELLACSVRIALPILAVLFVTNLALAFVARAAPQIQVFSVGFAVTLGVGILVLVLILPDIAYQMGAEFSHVGTRLERLLEALGGPS